MTSVAFNSSQDWEVPAEVTSITVKAWGAGGGGGGRATSFAATGGAGGGGGFAMATLAVTPGETLAVRVGLGGGGGDWLDLALDQAEGGAGGGFSGMFRGAMSQANALIIAGAGGGGGDTPSNDGGAGGGSSGIAGETGGGGAGTPSAGGAGGSLAEAGSALQGGAGADGSIAGSGNGSGPTGGAPGGGNGGGLGSVSGGSTGGGGGGGGYFGGGGGSRTKAGGGGSGYVTGTGTTLTAGSGANVANAGDEDYPGGVGNGGLGTAGAGETGQNGYVVISYVADTGSGNAGGQSAASGAGVAAAAGEGNADGQAQAEGAGEARIVEAGTGSAAGLTEVDGVGPPQTFGRGWPAAMYDALDQQVKRIAWAVKAEFDSGTARHWTGYGSLFFGDPAEEYIGAGDLLGFSPISESQDVKSTGIVINLKGVSNSLIALALQEEYTGRPCTVFMAMFDENLALLDQPQPVFSGRIDVIEMDPQPGGNANYAMSVESHMVDLRTARPRYYTSEDQQAFYPGDTFFDRVPQLQNARVIWGKG